jgi:hypothetical protein
MDDTPVKVALDLAAKLPRLLDDPAIKLELERSGDFDENLQRLIPGFKSLDDHYSLRLLHAYAKTELKLEGGAHELLEGMHYSNAADLLRVKVGIQNRQDELVAKQVASLAKKSTVRKSREREHLRRRVIELRAAKYSHRDMCERLDLEGFSNPWVIRWLEAFNSPAHRPKVDSYLSKLV